VALSSGCPFDHLGTASFRSSFALLAPGGTLVQETDLRLTLGAG